MFFLFLIMHLIWMLILGSIAAEAPASLPRTASRRLGTALALGLVGAGV